MNSRKLEIRRIVIGTSDMVVATESSTTVTVWSLKTRKLVNQFDSILEPGGAGVALSEAKQFCIVTGFYEGGVASYCLNSGTEKWRRPDLIKMQFVSLSEDDTTIYCGSTDGECSVISSDSGETVNIIDGVCSVWSTSTGTAMEVDGGIVFMTASGHRFRMKNETFAVLDVSVGEKYLGISDAGGGVRIYRTDTGDLECKFPQPPESHVLQLSTISSTRFVAVQWNYEEGGDCCVFQFDVANQTATEIGRFARPAAFAFYDSGHKILTSDGTTFDCESGKLTSTFMWS